MLLSRLWFLLTRITGKNIDNLDKYLVTAVFEYPHFAFKAIVNCHMNDLSATMSLFFHFPDSLSS